MTKYLVVVFITCLALFGLAGTTPLPDDGADDDPWDEICDSVPFKLFFVFITGFASGGSNGTGTGIGTLPGEDDLPGFLSVFNELSPFLQIVFVIIALFVQAAGILDNLDSLDSMGGSGLESDLPTNSLP